MLQTESAWDDPDFANAWNDTYGIDMSMAPTRAGLVFPWMEMNISDASNLRLIDIGCGNGNLIRHFTKASLAEMVGVDSGRAILQSAKNSLTDPRVKFVHASATNPFPFAETGKDFDLVSSIFVVEEIPFASFDNYCQTLHDVLKPQGKAFVFTNHPANALIEDHTSLMHGKPNQKFPDHKGYFDRDPSLYTLQMMNGTKGIEKKAAYHHKTIADILNSFNRAGLILQSMIEVPKGVVHLNEQSLYACRRGDIPRFIGFVFERQ